MVIEAIKKNFKGYLLATATLEFLLLLTYFRLRDMALLGYSMLIAPVILFILMLIFIALIGSKKQEIAQ